MKKPRLLGGAGSLLLLLSAPSHAITVLFFDGAVTYDSGSEVLEVTAELTSTVGIDPVPNTVGSSLSFQALLTGVDTVTDPTKTTGSFSTVSGDDLTVVDGDNNTLLIGEFSTLAVTGTNSTVVGSPGNEATGIGIVSATAGDLSGVFSTSPIVVELSNLTTPIDGSMYEGSFSGDVRGRIGVVPVPAALWLFSSGLLGLIGIVKRKTS